MRLLLTFIKPYKGLTAATVFALLLDVAGALFHPDHPGRDDQHRRHRRRRRPHHLDGRDHDGRDTPVRRGIAGRQATCAPNCAPTSGRDIRNAIYDSSLAFSDGDFKEFGTGSMITRTLNDVNIIQQGADDGSADPAAGADHVRDGRHAVVHARRADGLDHARHRRDRRDPGGADRLEGGGHLREAAELHRPHERGAAREHHRRARHPRVRPRPP